MQEEDSPELAEEHKETARRIESLFRNAGDDPLMLSLKEALLEYRLGDEE